MHAKRQIAKVIYNALLEGQRPRTSPADFEDIAQKVVEELGLDLFKPPMIDLRLVYKNQSYNIRRAQPLEWRYLSKEQAFKMFHAEVTNALAQIQDSILGVDVPDGGPDE